MIALQSFLPTQSIVIVCYTVFFLICLSAIAKYNSCNLVIKYYKLSDKTEDKNLRLECLFFICLSAIAKNNSCNLVIKYYKLSDKTEDKNLRLECLFFK